jgi:hypothetical protein
LKIAGWIDEVGRQRELEILINGPACSLFIDPGFPDSTG